MKKIDTILIFLLLGTGLYARHIEDNPLRLDSLLRAHQNMHFYQSPTLGRSDSVWYSTEHFYFYFDTDSICRQFIRKGGYNAIPDEMYHLYFSVFAEMTPERMALEIEKMGKAAEKYNSEALRREVELTKVFLLTYGKNENEQFEYKMEQLKILQQKVEKYNDIIIKLRVKENKLYTLYFTNHIFEAFEEAMEILPILDTLSDSQYSNRGTLYFFIGELFYMYGYNERAIPLFKKALKNAEYFSDRSNLRARNDLGLYYREQGDFDTSDQYFRSMLESPDRVQWRDEYDAIAICNLGKNYLLRKEYKKAEMLMQKGLPVMASFDPVFALGVHIALGNCYMAQGNLPQAKAMIDSAQKEINIYPSWGAPDINFYPLLSKYHAAAGNAKASAAYMDSTVRQHLAYKDQYNVSKIFQVEKKLNEAEKRATAAQLEVEKIEKQRYRNILIVSFLVIILLITFYTLYSRMRQQKIRSLYRQLKERDRLAEELKQMMQHYELAPSALMTDDRNGASHSDSLQDGEMQQLQVVYRLQKYMLEDDNYQRVGINRNDLAAALSTNRTTLSDSVRAITGKTLMEYVNQLRLDKARQLLDIRPDFTVETIAEECGFTHRTFYRLFKEHYNFSPAEYRKMGSEVVNPN